MVIILLLSLVLCVHHSFAMLECQVENKQCSLQEQLLSTKMGVATMEECSQLCQRNTDCKAFTHFGPENHFLSEACLLFVSCKQRVECKDCITASSQEECTCSIGYEGVKDVGNFEKLFEIK